MLGTEYAMEADKASNIRWSTYVKLKEYITYTITDLRFFQPYE